jgi:predicted GIY-YIG superfamily endonuclease
VRFAQSAGVSLSGSRREMKGKVMNMPYFVYMLECADGSYYIGSTTDLSRRLYQHEQGVIHTAYTFSRRPVKLVWYDEFPTKDDALNREHQIKGWSRKKKQALIQNDWEEIHEIVTEERKRRENIKKSNT